MTGHDETERSAVAGWEVSPGTAPRKQAVLGFAGRHDRGPAGRRSNDDVAIDLDARGPEDRDQRHALPVRLDRPARGAVKHGRPAGRAETVQLVEGECAVADPQAPAGRVNRWGGLAEERGLRRYAAKPAASATR